MDLKITKAKPIFSAVNKDKRIVMVEFPNCSFKWVPTYSQLTQIKQALDEIEVESWHE